MKTLLIALLLLSFNVFANDEDGPKTLDRFTCKLKVGKEKKLDIKFDGLRLDDETDILNVIKFYEVNFAGLDFKIAGGIAGDDECDAGKRCRTVLGMKIGNQPIAVGYANNASKIGVLTAQAKLSCTTATVLVAEELESEY
ncbi:MAG: hypothetical protein ACOYL6_18525 [Bacteriovoracaceae bacterium]